MNGDGWASTWGCGDLRGIQKDGKIPFEVDPVLTQPRLLSGALSDTMLESLSLTSAKVDVDPSSEHPTMS
ncbi:hypothetical protein Tco_0351018, partial [Tanacetum coccineum]